MPDTSCQVLIKDPDDKSDSPCHSCIHALCTSGNYADESEACLAFDEAVNRSGLFKVWKEVRGEMNQPQPGNNIKSAYRIDRVLVPTQKLYDSGWTKGLIGVEIKRSNIKAGPPLSQMLDYLRCVWIAPGNIKVMLDYIFLFPLEKTAGTIASLMAQNCVGSCSLRYPEVSEWRRFEFFLGEQKLITHYLNKNRVEIGNLVVGNRTGSR